jgi:hypothetical protein
MSNLVKILVIFGALVVIAAGIFVVVANWTDNEELLPPQLQDPATTEQVK